VVFSSRLSSDGTSPSPASAERRRTANRIFRGALIFNTALTLFWAVMLATRPTT
jgi:hypothetical protein